MSEQVMYSLDDVQDVVRFPQAANVPNVQISKFEYNESKDDETGKISRSLDVHFKTKLKEGTATLVDRIFEVDTDYIKSKYTLKEGETYQELIKKASSDLMSRLIHYSKQFGLTKDALREPLGTIASFKDLCEKYIKALNSTADYSTMFFLKTLPNKKKYTTLPKFPDFIQRMDKGACALSYNKYENGQIARIMNSAGVTSGEVFIEEEQASGEDVLDLLE